MVFFHLKALAANDTYVHRCDDYRFFTDVEHPTDRHFVKASNWSRREVSPPFVVDGGHLFRKPGTN